MKRIFSLFLFGLLLLPSLNASDTSEISVVAPEKGHFPLIFPKDKTFGVSKFGKGSYRLDGENSYGRFNCIFLFFEKAPVGNVAAKKEIEWKEEKIQSEGKNIIRKEAVILNPRPRQGDASGEILRIRVDALTPELAVSLSKIVEELIKNAQLDTGTKLPLN